MHLILMAAPKPPEVTRPKLVRPGKSINVSVSKSPKKQKPVPPSSPRVLIQATADRVQSVAECIPEVKSPIVNGRGTAEFSDSETAFGTCTVASAVVDPIAHRKRLLDELTDRILEREARCAQREAECLKREELCTEQEIRDVDAAMQLIVERERLEKEWELMEREKKKFEDRAIKYELQRWNLKGDMKRSEGSKMTRDGPRERKESVSGES